MPDIAQDVGSVERGGAVAGAVHGGPARSSADVHIALSRIANIDEQALQKIAELLAVVDDLKGAVIGNERFGHAGIIQQVREMRSSDKRRERWHLVNSILIATIMLGQIAHTAALIYLFRFIWGY